MTVEFIVWSVANKLTDSLHDRLAQREFQEAS